MAMIYENNQYNDTGDWCVASWRVNKTRKLTSLEIRCSASVMKNMSDEEIEAQHDKTGDYDANELNMNVFVNGFCIKFNFNLFGLDVHYNAWNATNPSRTDYIDLDIVHKTIEAVAWWFQDKTIEMINEKFYFIAEKEVAEEILDTFMPK